jgi:hypothetical protein
MKNTLERLILILGLSCMTLGAADPRMTAEERSKVLNLLADSRQEFLSAIDGVTEQQWRWKPGIDRWAVGEVAEHIVLAESSQFGNVKSALAMPMNSAWDEETRGKTERLEAILAPRLGKVQAPEALVPKGKMTLAQVRERFERQRTEIVKFSTETDLPLKQHTLNNPFFGALNGYQWRIYAPLHTMRHVKQITEVKGTSGYPK